MGNLSIKGYTPTSKDSFKAGTNSIWKVFPAKKSSTGKEGSIFFFEKRKYKNTPLSKEHKEENLAIMRREAQKLSKYMHPSVLKILEPFHEDSHVIGFVTEKVKGNLAQILEQKAEVPIRSDPTELKIILMELLEGISYLNDVSQFLNIFQQTNSVHLNISPENIFVTEDGKWKIGGFAFLCQSEAGVFGCFNSLGSVHSSRDHAWRE